MKTVEEIKKMKEELRDAVVELCKEKMPITYAVKMANNVNFGIIEDFAKKKASDHFDFEVERHLNDIDSSWREIDDASVGCPGASIFKRIAGVE